MRHHYWHLLSLDSQACGMTSLPSPAWRDCPTKKKGCCPLECVALNIMTKVTITTITMIVEHVLTDGQCLKSLLYNELCRIDIRIGYKGGFLLDSRIPLVIDLSCQHLLHQRVIFASSLHRIQVKLTKIVAVGIVIPSSWAGCRPHSHPHVRAVLEVLLRCHGLVLL
jgi:hypothetical protein